MKPTRKSGKEGRAKEPRKKTAIGTRPARPATTGSGRAGDALKENEEKYKLLIEATNTGYVIIDDQGRVLDANEEYVKISGHDSLAEIAGRAVTEWTASYDLERNAAEIRKCLKSGSVRNLVIDYVGPQGRVTPVEINATMLRGAGLPRIFTVCRDITERKRTEDALRESEAKARSIIASIPVGMHLYRLEDGGRLVFMGANPAADTILGVDNSSFIGKTIEEAFPQLKETEVPRRYREAAASGKAWHTEQVNYHEGVIQGAFEVHAFQTAPNTMVAAFVDITQRKQMEEALRTSELRYKAIVDTQAEFVVRYQPGGILTFVNDTLCKYVNMKPEDLLGRSYYPFMHPDDRDEFIRKIEALDRKNPSMVAEARVVLPDGRESWHRWTHHAIFDERGDLVEYQCTGRDVTELKQAEARIKVSERKYRDLFESSNDGIFILDLEGNFIDVNPAAYTRLGYTREEMLSLHISKVDTPEFAEKVPERIRRLREQGAAVFESANRRKDGSVMQIEVSARLLDYEGRPVLFSVNRDVTERKQAEEALRRSEKMLQAIIDAEPDCIKIIDEESRIIMMNRAGLNMVQADSFEQVKGQVVCPLVAPEYQQAFMDLTRQVFLGRSGKLEFQMTGMRGRQLWLETHAVPLRNEKDEISAMLGVTRDITERKQAEQERERLAKAVSIVSEGIAVTDEQDRFIYLNDAHAKTYGYVPHELIGKTWRDVTPREFVPLIESELARTLHSRENGVWSGESPGLCRDGTGIATEITATARWNEKGEYQGHICVVRDITERKQAEEALRLSESRFRTIIEHASSGILAADIETGKFLYANPEICRMLGYRSEELLTLYVPDIHPEEDLPLVRKTFAAREGVQTRCRRKDGSVFPVDIRSVELVLDGRPCLAGFFTDITEKRLLEEERLKTQKLESVGTLAGGIAHDFNNLLQGVFGYISMAKLSLAHKDRAAAMLEQAEKALHQSVNLTTQLLTFSKGGKPVKKVIDLRPVIENAVKFALSGSRVDYRLDLAGDLLACEADEGQIGQVIQNIVLNADHAMPLGGRIEVTARNVPATRAAGLPLSAPDGLVEIVVRDQGTGIPPEHLPRIFDPYFTTKEKGSGLGLATSYSIIKNHDGMISVSSELGKGSTFTVHLPASRAAQEQAASASAGRVACRKGRILVMDDEDLIRVVAGELLRELGHEAEFAEHGDGAIEQYTQAKAEGRPFDVVILDLTVRGGKGGAETLRELLKIDPGVKAVVSSGYSDDEVVATYRQHGFRSFLKKPYDIEELDGVLNDVMT